MNPREYLADILSRLPYCTHLRSAKDINELLPHRWQAEIVEINIDIGVGVGQLR